MSERAVEVRPGLLEVARRRLEIGMLGELVETDYGNALHRSRERSVDVDACNAGVTAAS